MVAIPALRQCKLLAVVGNLGIASCGVGRRTVVAGENSFDRSAIGAVPPAGA
jgi:hypothetical protein